MCSGTSRWGSLFSRLVLQITVASRLERFHTYQQRTCTCRGGLEPRSSRSTTGSISSRLSRPLTLDAGRGHRPASFSLTWIRRKQVSNLTDSQGKPIVSEADREAIGSIEQAKDATLSFALPMELFPAGTSPPLTVLLSKFKATDGSVFYRLQFTTMDDNMRGLLVILRAALGLIEHTIGSQDQQVPVQSPLIPPRPPIGKKS